MFKLLGTLLLGAAVVLPLHEEALAQTTFKLAVESPEGDPGHFLVRSMRDNLAEALGDGASVQFFEGGALGDGAILSELIRAAQIDIIALGSDAAELDPSFAVFDAPFLFGTKDIARGALDGEVGELLKASLEEKTGLKVLSFGELGFRMITNNVRPITKPEDLAGLKIRTPGSAPRIMTFQALGAVPTSLNLGETYLALQQGVLDGQENPVGTIKTFSLFEVQKYLAASRHVYTPMTLVMNGTKWASLDAETQEVVLAAAAKASAESRAYNDEAETAAMEAFAEAGMEISEIDLPAFKAAMPPIYEKIGEIVGPDFMQQVIEAVGS